MGQRGQCSNVITGHSESGGEAQDPACKQRGVVAWKRLQPCQGPKHLCIQKISELEGPISKLGTRATLCIAGNLILRPSLQKHYIPTRQGAWSMGIGIGPL